MASAFARVYDDPYVNYLVNAFRSTAKVDTVVRVNGEDVSMYDVMWSVVKHAGPPVAAVANVVGKIFVNTQPASIDYLRITLKDANDVVIGELETSAVSSPITIDAVGEYIINITIHVSAPTSVSVTVR